MQGSQVRAGAGPVISRHASAWTPLAVPAFRAVWIASLASNIAIWLGNVGMAWLMTELRPTPVMVTLVQAATSLPVFLFALPAGAVGDLVDRRSLLGVLQIASALLSVGLGVSTALGLTTPALILAAAFFLGTTLAFGMPVFQAIVPDLVPLRELAPAVSLNSIGINIARVIGPALGGAMILYWGAAAPFLINTVFYAAVIFLLYRCLPALPAMHRGVRMGTAVLDGIRHTLGSPAARATLIRSGGYAFFASMYFSLLPLIARDQVGGGAGVYGLLLGCLGSGGIVSVILLPRWRLRRSPDSVARAGSVASAVLLVAIAPTHSEWLMVPLLLAAGLAWVAQVATVNVAAQSMLPGWVRARGLSIFMIVFNGMMALGSALWGLIASVVGLSWAFALSGCGLLLFEAAAARCRLPGDDFAGTAKLDEPRDLARSATVE